MKLRMLTLDPEALADSLQYSVDAVFQTFSDGRTVAPHAARWVEDLYGEGHVTHILTKNVQFQRSKRQGVGRDATEADLRADLLASPPLVVVDINDFPTISFHAVDQAVLLHAHARGVLNKSGLTRRKFYRELLGTDLP